jgi:hypothetical protein
MASGVVEVARIAVVPAVALALLLLILAIARPTHRVALMILAGIALAVAVLAFGYYLPHSA